jgi:hypothetical protein
MDIVGYFLDDTFQTINTCTKMMPTPKPIKKSAHVISPIASLFTMFDGPSFGQGWVSF